MAVLGAACIAAVVAAAPASADQLPNRFGPPATLTISLIGTIGSQCGFSSAPPTNAMLNDLTQANSLTLNFSLECNAGFAVGVSSQNGGLKNSGVTGVLANGFTDLLDYKVALQYQTDLGTVSGHCDAASLAAASPTCNFYGTAPGQGLSSGDGVAAGTPGSMTLSWTPPPNKKIAAGKYGDTITVTVGTRI